MRISQKGLDLIKSFEGLRLSAYRCPADIPTYADMWRFPSRIL
jgi:lysozyme